MVPRRSISFFRFLVLYDNGECNEPKRNDAGEDYAEKMGRVRRGENIDGFRIADDSEWPHSAQAS